MKDDQALKDLYFLLNQNVDSDYVIEILTLLVDIICIEQDAKGWPDEKMSSILEAELQKIHPFFKKYPQKGQEIIKLWQKIKALYKIESRDDMKELTKDYNAHILEWIAQLFGTTKERLTKIIIQNAKRKKSKGVGS